MSESLSQLYADEQRSLARLVVPVLEAKAAGPDADTSDLEVLSSLLRPNHMIFLR